MTTTQASPTTLTLTIDGHQVTASQGLTILEAAQAAGIYIPTLCWDPRLKSYGACRMCVVQPEGRRQFPASCVTPAADGMAIRTNTPEVVALRQNVLGLLMSEHPHGCLNCDRVVHCGPTDICLRNVSVTDRCVVCPQNQRCELQAVVEITGVDESIYKYTYRQLPIRTEDPYIDRDYNLCIACVRCVRVCDEIIGADAISMVDKGDRVLPGTPYDVPLSDPASGCIFCGACVDACPVGALTEKENKWAGLPDRTVTTICDQCEIGCQVTVELKGQKILRVLPDLDGGANAGLACIKGKFQLADPARREDRLLEPALRRNGALEPASWDEALDAAARALAPHKGDSFALLATGTPSNEDAYLLEKFARQVMASPHIDNLPRALSPAIPELQHALGIAASTNPLQEIAQAKAILFLGADLEKTHPVAAFQMHKAVNYQDAHLIAITPDGYPEITRAATQWLHLRRGSDCALLTGILKVIIDEGLVDWEFVVQRTEGHHHLVDSLHDVDLDAIAQETGVPVDAIQQAARTYAATRPATIVYAVDTSIDSTGIAAALANLALLTGNIGKPSTGLHILRSDGNTQGSQDMGLAPRDGESDLDAILDAIENGRIKSLLWAGDLPSENSVLPQSLEGRATQDLPASLQDRLARALPQLDFFAMIALAPGDLAQHAHLLLPASPFLERDGTYTNAERRVQHLRPALSPAGQSRPLWQAIADLARRLGATGFDYDDASQLFAELADATPDYSGLSYRRLNTNITGLQWPVPTTDHPGTPILYTEAFPTESGKARLRA